MLQDMSVRHTDIYPLEQVHSYFNLLTILNSLWAENISLLSSWIPSIYARDCQRILKTHYF